MPLVIVNADPDGTIFREKIAQDFQTGTHQIQPLTVLQIIVIMFKCISRVVWRIDINAFDLPGETDFQGFQGEQIVSMD